jgi:hypothetical protein
MSKACIARYREDDEDLKLRIRLAQLEAAVAG